MKLREEIDALLRQATTDQEFTDCILYTLDWTGGNSDYNSNLVLTAIRQAKEPLEKELRAMAEARDTYAEGFSTQSMLHGKFARLSEQQEARIKRLREALEKLNTQDAPKEVRKICRTALTETQSDKT